MLLELSKSLCPQTLQEVPIINSSESTLQVPSTCFEIVRNRNTNSGANGGRDSLGSLAKKLEQHVAAQRNSSKEERGVGISLGNQVERQSEVAGFAGMVQPGGGVEMRTTAAENQYGGIPAPALGAL